MNHESPRFESLQVGDRLPELTLDITASLVVGGALASRDYTPVHHDRAAAQAAGMQDVFMNILTTNGLVSRYVTDWAGIDARITGVAIKLGTPNFPGDTLTLTGAVMGKHESRGELEVTVTGRNRWGNHVTGTVKVVLPKGA